MPACLKKKMLGQIPKLEAQQCSSKLARYLTLRSQVHKKIIISLFSEPTNFFSRQPEKKFSQQLKNRADLARFKLFIISMDFFERVHNMLIFFFLSLTRFLTEFITHSLSLSLLHAHTLSHILFRNSIGTILALKRRSIFPNV